jgi:hypothetical protein
MYSSIVYIFMKYVKMSLEDEFNVHEESRIKYLRKFSPGWEIDILAAYDMFISVL